ncbi:uncharacterized protein [Diadema setosum]|uniref:uncharacterized protein n=1 Tax=Diadema setosum TaxID=31175 RepID=UPI003B3A766B
MWTLESLRDEGSKFNFLVGEDQIVGRKDCQILISGDASISRKHATLTVKHPEMNLSHPRSPSSLLITESSKYGTFLNGQKLASGSETKLKDGDVITFGTFKSNKWRVKFCPLIAAASALPTEEKRNLKRAIHKLGGHLVSEWSYECTHLVMSQLNVTVKLISALVACRPVVTPNFWHHIREAIAKKESLPESHRYLPPLAEESINENEVSFVPDERRKTIFQGMTFYFLTQKQYKRLHIAIGMAGGQSQLIEEDNDVKDLRRPLTSKGACVLYTEHKDSSQEMSQLGQDVTSRILKLLKQHGLRPIPESELGLAVLYVSTELHCNPKVAQAGLNLLDVAPSVTLPTEDVLASDTQTLTQRIQEGKMKAEPVSNSVASTNQLRKNVTSTPKISKIDESIVGKASTSVQSTSAHQADTSPEFPRQLKTEMRADKSAGIKSEPEEDRGERGVKQSTEVDVDEERKNVQGRHTRGAVHIKEEKMSPVVVKSEKARRREESLHHREEADSSVAQATETGRSSLPMKPERSEPEEEGSSGSSVPIKTETQSDDEGATSLGSTVRLKQENQSSTAKGKREVHERTERAGLVEVKNTMETVVRVKEEPMDESGDGQMETGGRQDDKRTVRRALGIGGTTEATREQEEEEEEEEDLWGDRGRKRSAKRKAHWSSEGDDDSRDERKRDQAVRIKASSKEDGGSSMWKKKARVDIFSQEEDTFDSQSAGNGHAPTKLLEEDVDLPRGFISARVPIEDQISVKVDEEYVADEQLPSKLLQVKSVDLIVQRDRKPRQRAVQVAQNGRPVKNFKRFRKAGFAGQCAVPRIIGGRDLFKHCNKPSKDIEEMFNEEVRAERKRNKQEEKAEELFAYQSRKGSTAKRKR